MLPVAAVNMETPTKNLNVLQSNRRKSQYFQYRPNVSFDDPCASSLSQHSTSLFHTDSGYTSESISFDSPDSYHGSHRSSVGVSHLEPIIEGVEMHCHASTVELTPTTRNLNQLSAFHITTPVSPATKRPSSSSLQSIDSGSANKSRRLAITSNQQHVTPRKGALLQRQQSFMDKLDNLENIENQPNATSFYADRMEFSPIVGHRGAAFERQPSEHTLQSSTPIDANWGSRFKGNTGHKVVPAANRRIRKTQSFSPSKHFQSKYDMAAPLRTSVVLGLPSPKPPASPLASGSSINPARKLLDFNDGIFESLVKSCEPRPKLCRQALVSSDTDVEMTFVTPTKQRLSSTLTTPTTNPDSNQSIVSRTDIILNSAIVIESPNFKPICHQYLLQTPKKLTRSFSLTSPRREQNDILYAHLPCTPPKSASKRKRLATTKLVRRSPVKRKLYESKSKICLVGMERLDIVGRLEGVCPAIDRICKYLSTSDLANVRQVSRRWCRILESNKWALNRVKRKARRQEVSKENLDSIAAAPTATAAVCHKSRVPFSRCNSVAGGAIVVASIESPAEPQTPVLSPRTRAFQDNQKLIKTLTKTQRLMKCPRCSGSSIIDRFESNASFDHLSASIPNAARLNVIAKSTPRLGAITKHQSCPIPFQTPTNIDWSAMDESPVNDDSGIFGGSVDGGRGFFSSSLQTRKTATNDTTLEYGHCTSKGCGFVFCVNCWCDFHGDRKCRRAGSKLSSSQERTPYVACSKQSKRNLRRLCSLEP